MTNEAIIRELRRMSDRLDARLAAIERLLTPVPPPKSGSEPADAPGPIWRSWKGGFCPVSDTTRVWVNIENVEVVQGLARDFNWRRQKNRPNIVGWQLHKDQSTEDYCYMNQSDSPGVLR